MLLSYLLSTLYVLVCLVLLLAILLQQGKGGDMASAFGGGSSQTAFGARGGATVLSKATTVFAVLFMLGALALAILGERGPGSLVSGTPAPVGAPKTPVSGPTKPATPAAPAGQTPAGQAPANQAPAAPTGTPPK